MPMQITFPRRGRKIRVNRDTLVFPVWCKANSAYTEIRAVCGPAGADQTIQGKVVSSFPPRDGIRRWLIAVRLPKGSAAGDYVVTIAGTDEKGNASESESIDFSIGILTGAPPTIACPANNDPITDPTDFTPWGTLSAQLASVNPVTLQNANTNIQCVDSVGIPALFFWTAQFATVPQGQNYILRVEDVNQNAAQVTGLHVP